MSDRIAEILHEFNEDTRQRDRPTALLHLAIAFAAAEKHAADMKAMCDSAERDMLEEKKRAERAEALLGEARKVLTKIDKDVRGGVFGHDPYYAASKENTMATARALLACIDAVLPFHFTPDMAPENQPGEEGHL